tara:strand:+ start:81 stop:533 length:453 start_codon:yes stop_codon:yes gene_type:complete
LTLVSAVNKDSRYVLSAFLAGLSRCVGQTMIGRYPFTSQQDAARAMSVEGGFCSSRLDDDVALLPIVKSVALPTSGVLFEKTIETLVSVLNGFPLALDHQGGQKRSLQPQFGLNIGHINEVRSFGWVHDAVEFSHGTRGECYVKGAGPHR